MDPGTSGEDLCVAAAVACADAAAGTDVSDDSEQSMPQNHRAAHHTNTSWQNAYFVLTDNKHFLDVKMRVGDCWKGPADLGRPCGSKTLVPSHYGDDRAEPDQVILAPKVLMVYIWQQNDGRFLQRSCRQRAWQREVESLTRSCLLALHLATRAWLL